MPIPSDFLMLFQDPSFAESELVKEMISRSKKNYVLSNHKNSIFQMNVTGKRHGWYKTNVRDADGNRKQLVAKSEDALFEKLFSHYKSLEEGPATLQKAFDMLMDKKKNENNRSANTITEDVRYFQKISDALKQAPVASITEENIRKWITNDYMMTKPKETALKKMLQLFSQIFRHAMHEHLCTTNPAEYISKDDYLKDCNLNTKTDEERSFSKEEILRIEQDAKRTPKEPCALMTLLASETGMRAGELSALLKSDVSGGFIHVHRQLLRNKREGHFVFYEVEYTKDEKNRPHGGRYVPISPRCQEVLDLAFLLPGESDHLFHYKDGRAITTDTYEQNLSRRCKRLGIGTTNNHAFRIAFNSRLIELGFSSADRALILGHAVETNERHYSVSDRRRLDSIWERLQ